MKHRILFLLVLLLAVFQGRAGVITADVESLNFGEIEIGYPVTLKFNVTGQDLTDNINLTLEGRHTYFYEVTPETITPDAAAAGVTVKVKCKPVSEYNWPVNLVLSSPDAESVAIPLDAEPFYPETFVNNRAEEFTAHVGQIVTRRGAIRFADYEVPTDPNTPVVRSNSPMLNVAPNYSNNYSFTIEGEDSNCFSAMIVKSSSIVNICTVAINYVPLSCGTHSATLKVYCQTAGVPLVTIPLRGESNSVLGDLNADGSIGITDVVDMIGLLMTLDAEPELGDVNCDGMFNITDVTLTIGKILEAK